MNYKDDKRPVLEETVTNNMYEMQKELESYRTKLLEWEERQMEECEKFYDEKVEEFWVRIGEMAQNYVSSIGDDLPFLIVTQNPDFDPPHAHLISLDDRKEIGTIKITDNTPLSIDDLVPYKVRSGKHKGLDNLSTMEQQRIVTWANQKSKRKPSLTNWELLKLAFDMRDRWPPMP